MRTKDLDERHLGHNWAQDAPASASSPHGYYRPGQGKVGRSTFVYVCEDREWKIPPSTTCRPCPSAPSPRPSPRTPSTPKRPYVNNVLTKDYFVGFLKEKPQR